MSSSGVAAIILVSCRIGWILWINGKLSASFRSRAGNSSLSLPTPPRSTLPFSEPWEDDSYRCTICTPSHTGLESSRRSEGWRREVRVPFQVPPFLGAVPLVVATSLWISTSLLLDPFPEAPLSLGSRNTTLLASSPLLCCWSLGTLKHLVCSFNPADDSVNRSFNWPPWVNSVSC